MTRDKTQTAASPELAALLALQSAIALKTSDITRLTESIATKRAMISKLEASLPDLPDLQRQRQYLLSVCDEGQGNAADVAKLDTQITKAKSKVQQVAQETAIAKDTIAGYETRIQDAEAACQVLQGKLRAHRGALLLTEVDAAGTDYVTKAMAARDAFLKLKGLAQIIGGIESGANLYEVGGQICLPSFNVDCVQAHASNVPPYALFDPHLVGGKVYMLAMRDQQQRLAALGVEFE